MKDKDAKMTPEKRTDRRIRKKSVRILPIKPRL